MTVGRRIPKKAGHRSETRLVADFARAWKVLGEDWDTLLRPLRPEPGLAAKDAIKLLCEHEFWDYFQGLEAGRRGDRLTEWERMSKEVARLSRELLGALEDLTPAMRHELQYRVSPLSPRSTLDLVDLRRALRLLAGRTWALETPNSALRRSRGAPSREPERRLVEGLGSVLAHVYVAQLKPRRGGSDLMIAQSIVDFVQGLLAAFRVTPIAEDQLRKIARRCLRLGRELAKAPETEGNGAKDGARTEAEYDPIVESALWADSPSNRSEIG